MKSVRNLWFGQDFDMRARRSAHVSLMVLVERDSSYVVRGCWFASKGGEMKSLDSNEIKEFIWFSFDFRRSARSGNLSDFC